MWQKPQLICACWKYEHYICVTVNVAHQSASCEWLHLSSNVWLHLVLC